jgi:hypothetical protein
MDRHEVLFGFGTDDSHELAILTAAEALGDGDAVTGTNVRKGELLTAEQDAQRVLGAARAVRGYPADHLARLEAEAERRTAARRAFAAELEAAGVRRLKDAETQRTAALTRLLARPTDIDAADDREALREWRATLKAQLVEDLERELLADARALLKLDAGVERTRLRQKVRAALTAPTGSLIRPPAERVLADWLVAGANPQVVRDARVGWRLREIGRELARAEFDRYSGAAVRVR